MPAGEMFFVLAVLLFSRTHSVSSELVPISAEMPRLNPGPPGPVAPTFNLSLDDPPATRWSHIVREYADAKQAIVDYFDNQVHSKEVQDVLDDIGANMDKYLGDSGQEMQGIAQQMGIDVGVVVMLNFGYELRHLGPGRPNTTGNATQPMDRSTFHSAGACTSIVVQSEDYSVIHGRNLDWNLPDELRHLIMQGFLNGVTFNGFSGSINERLLGGSLILDAIQAVRAGVHSPTHLLRQLLVEQSSYPEAVARLVSERITAPVYFIVAGVARDEGAIITRDRNKLDDVWQLRSSSDQPYAWFLLETNYDRWTEPVPYDNRRKYGNEYMTNLGRQAASTYDGLVSVLNTWPVRNNETTWTSLMSPKTGYHTTYIVY